MPVRLQREDYNWLGAGETSQHATQRERPLALKVSRIAFVRGERESKFDFHAGFLVAFLRS